MILIWVSMKNGLSHLFELELFTHFEPMGVEYMMSNPDKDVGGQLDLIGYDTKAKKIRLIDLKTKGDTKYDFKKGLVGENLIEQINN